MSKIFFECLTFYEMEIAEKKVLRAYKLTCEGKCDKYDPEIDATTTIEYATSAFKWFHPNVPTFLHLVDAHDKLIRKVPFSDTYLNFTLLKDGNYLNLLRGLLKHKQRMNRVGYSGEVCTFDSMWIFVFEI